MTDAGRPTVACVGQTNVDHVFAIDTSVSPGEKHHATSSSVIVGGGAANQAITVARLGGRALLVSRLGDDAAATTALMELRAAGVDVSLVEQFHDVHTATSAVIVDRHGDRTIFGQADPALYFGRPPDLPKLDAIVTDARWGSATMAALRQARDLGVPSVVDIDERVPVGRLRRIEESATHIVYSLRGLTRHAPAPDVTTALRRAQRRTSAFVAVTCGAQGVMWLDGGEARHRTPPEVDAVDTTGAGDVFHAAFACALAERRTLDEAIDVGIITAALMCASPLGRRGIPERADVDATLAHLGPMAAS